MAGPASQDSSSGPVGVTGPYTWGLGYDSVLFLWQGGTWSGPMSQTEREVPFYAARMVGGEGGPGWGISRPDQ